MSQLKYAILGVLYRKDMTGYDIFKEFNANLNHFWSAKHSQIYSELKKLTDNGFLEFITVIQGEKLEKKLYSITVKGKEDFNQWIRTVEPLEPTAKDKFRLKIFFADALSVEELRQLLADQLKKRREKLGKLEEMQGFLKQNEQVSVVCSPEFTDFIVLVGAIKRERAYVEWIEECMSLCSTHTI